MLQASGGGPAPKTTKKKVDYSAFNSQANVKDLVARNTAQEKQNGAWAGLDDTAGGILYGIGGVNSNAALQALGKAVAAGNEGTHKATPQATVGYDPSKSFYGGGELHLDALNSKANAVNQAAAAGGGGGGGASGYGWAPTPVPAAASYKVDTSNLPTLAKTGDLASFMALAQKESHLGDVKKPYEDVKNTVTQDAGISEAQAKAMYAALQGQLSAGATNIAGGYDAANANAAQSERGLAAQVANTYGAGSSSANAQAQALGMGSLGGQVADNSLRASQGALGDLQSSLQASQAETNGDKAAALGANRDMGAAVGARSAQDVGNMAMAASDAKARVGVAEGNAYNQAAQASAALGGNLWSTALANNLGAFNANIGLWNDKTNAGLSAAQQAETAWAAQQGLGLQGAQLGESQRQFDLGYGLNEAQFGASVLGAKNSAIQAYLAQIQKAIGDQRLYGGTQPSSIAAELAAIQGGKAASPYSSILPNLNLGSAGAAQYGG